MEVWIRFPDEELAALLERFQLETGKSWPDLLRQQGRLIAVNLAHNTQPYGFADTAKKMGEYAVIRDIGRVFWDSPSAYVALREKSEKAARVCYRALMSGKLALAHRILQANGIDVPIGELQAGLHKSRRNARGHVSARKNSPSLIVVKGKQIDKYAKEIQRRVGFGKSGWASCAQSLGGMRGIAQWAKRGRAPGGVNDQSKSLNNPQITLQNNVRYIGKICRQSSINDALRIQREKMEKHMTRVIEAAAKKAGLEVS